MFGKRISQERQRLNLTQQQLAEHLGVGRSAVAMLETGRAAVDLERLLSLEPLGMDLLFIVFGEKGSTVVGRLFDWELLGDIIRAIREWSDSRKITIPAEKEVALCKLLYNHFAECGTIDKQVLRDVLKLAA